MFHTSRAVLGSFDDARPVSVQLRPFVTRGLAAICGATMALSVAAFSTSEASAADSRRLSAASPTSSASTAHLATMEVVGGGRSPGRFGFQAQEQGASSEVVAAVRAASEATGIDPAFLMAVAWKESRLDPSASNPKSSADGLLQFTASTWIGAVRDFGKRHGIQHEGRSRAAVLALRRDPRLSATLAAELILREGAQMSEEIGRPVNQTDLYLTHRLGTGGATRFLRALQRSPNRRAADVAPEAARGAPEEFGGRTRHLTVAQVYEGYRARLEWNRMRFVGVLSGPFEVAEAR